MREIKFRAWDKKNKKWFEDWFCIYCSGNVGVLLDDGNSVVISERLIPVQYTGLKDKNGKEIYEGDIVTWNEKELMKHGLEKVIGSIKYFIDGFVVSETGHSDYSIFGRYKSFEVIGNIYENSGLVKE